MTGKAFLSGAEFKRAASAVRRFPSVGTFAGAGLVHFAAGIEDTDKAECSCIGIVCFKCDKRIVH